MYSKKDIEKAIEETREVYKSCLGGDKDSLILDEKKDEDYRELVEKIFDSVMDLFKVVLGEGKVKKDKSVDGLKEKCDDVLSCMKKGLRDTEMMMTMDSKFDKEAIEKARFAFEGACQFVYFLGESMGFESENINVKKYSLFGDAMEKDKRKWGESKEDYVERIMKKIGL